MITSAKYVKLDMTNSHPMEPVLCSVVQNTAQPALCPIIAVLAIILPTLFSSMGFVLFVL